MQTAARSAHDEESVIANALDYLEDLDAAIDFMTQWHGGSVLGLQPGQRTDRRGLNVRLSERAARDPDFRRALLRHPRYLSAMAVHEGFWISPLEFLWQVKAVNIVEEAPGLHWLVVPACHRGCEVRDAATASSSGESCSVCGRPVGAIGGCGAAASTARTDADRIHAVDELILRTVDADRSARAGLLADPNESFAQACVAIFGDRPSGSFGIQEVRVAVDTETVLYFVLLAKHEPGVSATSVQRQQAAPVAHFSR